MKKNLGKIVLLLLISVKLFATVTLSVDKQTLVLGDELHITISADSANTVLPVYEKIGEFEVLNISSSSRTSIINSAVTHTKSRTYTIKPTSDFLIPKLKIMVNGREEFTSAKDIKVLQSTPKTIGSNSQFILELQTDKNEVKVGESFIVKVIFKRDLTTTINKIALDDLKHEAFWIKKIGSDEKEIKANFEIYTRTYLLFAQKEGKFKIENLIAKVGILKQQKSNYNDPFFDSFFQQMVYKRVRSNSLNIKVSPLPNNLEIYGDFTIEASVDKSTLKANKPLNLLLKIQGEGNIEDIKKINLKIPNTTIFTDEPDTKVFIRDGKSYGEFSQKFAIISDSNFTIPPIVFSYFSSKEDKALTIKTKKIKITVKNSISKKEINIEKETNTKSQNITVADDKSKYLYLIFGVFLGIFLTILTWFIKTKKPKKDDTPLVKKVKKAKSDKELYNLLLPLAKDEKIKPILKELENNIYTNSSNKKIVKKDILTILQEIKH